MKQYETKTGETVNRISLMHCSTGDLVKRKPDSETVYVINHRSSAKEASVWRNDGQAEFSLSPVDDMNREIFLKESTLIYVGFTY